MGIAGPKRLTVLDAVTAAGTYSEPINVTDFDAITVSFSTIALSDQKVLVQGAIRNSDDKLADHVDFELAAEVGNEWAYKEIINQADSTDVIAGGTGITFVGATVAEYTVNTERLDFLSFSVPIGTAGGLTARILCFKS